MNQLKFFFISATLLFSLMACHQKAVMEKKPQIKEVKKPTPPPKQPVQEPVPEKKVAQPQPKDIAPYQINTLVRQLYQWHHTQGRVTDFPLLDDEEKYTGLNQPAFANRLQQLRDTNLFSTGFINNYAQIGQEIDRRLITGKMDYWVGDMPPYGNDADPWTNAQDIPSETYWQTLRIRNLIIQNNQGSLSWLWPQSFGEQDYLIGVVKENNRWRINYMQGFDFKAYFR